MSLEHRSLQVFGQENGVGEIIYATNTSSARLGGLSFPRKVFIPLDLSIPHDTRIRKAYLEIAATVASVPHTKWRVWVSGKPITREFKPQITMGLEEGVYTKSIYDVTPFFADKEALNRYVVSIYYEGSQPITVDHVGFLVLLDNNTSYYSYTYLSGAMIIPPDKEEELEVKLPSPPDSGETTMKLVLKIPSKYAETRIYLNNKEVSRLTGIVGIDYLELRGLDLGSSNRLKITHVKSGEKYFPKNLVVSTIFLSKVLSKKPLVVIDGLDYAVTEDGLDIDLRVTNKGEIETDKTLVVVMEHGSPLARVELGSLKPGEIKSSRISAKLGKGYHILTLRCIWSKRGKTDFIEEKIRVAKS